MKTLRLKKKEDRRIRRGHPWVFSNELATPLTGITPGDLIRIEDHSGGFVGIGYANPHSLIAVRLLTRHEEAVDFGFISARVQDAKAYREAVYPGRDSYRAVFSESDLLPGLVADKYADWLSVQVLTAGMERLLPLALEALKEAYTPAGIVLRNDSGLRALEGLPQEVKVVHGEYAGPVQIALSGARLLVDLTGGQKTGFFLDQADNYGLLSSISEGREALDLFCHTGAWSVMAARFGAKSCTGVDSSAPALELAKENARLNSLGDRVSFERDDVFDFLKRTAASGKRYGVVVCDPPAFIKSRAKLAEGLKGYRDLNARVMKAVAPGGWLISCSCSHHLDRETFLDVLRSAAASAGRAARVAEIRSQSKDHPVLLAAPETEYLKCALMQVM